MDKKKHKSDPYVHIIFSITITLLQIYFLLNCFTRVLDSIPDIAMESQNEAADFLLIFNISGVITALAYDKEDYTIELTKYNILNTLFQKLIPISQFSLIISIALAVVSTPFLYFGGFEEIVVERGIRVLLVIIIAVIIFLITFLYYYIKIKVKK